MSLHQEHKYKLVKNVSVSQIIHKFLLYGTLSCLYHNFEVRYPCCVIQNIINGVKNSRPSLVCKTLYTTECNTEDTDTPTEGAHLEHGAHLPTQDHSDTLYPQHRKGHTHTTSAGTAPAHLHYVHQIN